MDKKRRILLSTLIKTLEYHKMDIEEMGDFFIEFQETEMLDQFFGKLSAKTETTKSENLIVVRNRDALAVLDNISNLHLLRGKVPGIECNKDGTCTVDMSTSWITQFGITEDDFRNGNRRLLRAPTAQKILDMSSNSFVRTSHFQGRVTKFGKIWVVDAEAVQEYKDYRSNPQLSLLGQKS